METDEFTAYVPGKAENELKIGEEGKIIVNYFKVGLQVNFKRFL